MTRAFSFAVLSNLTSGNEPDEGEMSFYKVESVVSRDKAGKHTHCSMRSAVVIEQMPRLHVAVKTRPVVVHRLQSGAIDRLLKSIVPMLGKMLSYI